MSGLLDAFDSDQFRLGLGLLAAGGARGDGMSTGGRIQEAFNGMDAYKKQKMLEQERKAQIDEAQRKREQERINEAAIRKAFMPMQGGAAMQNGQGPTLGNAANIGQVQRLDPRQFLSQNPQASMGALEQAMKFDQAFNPAKKLMTVAPGASVLDERDPTKALYTAPDKADKGPTAVQEYNFAKGQGYQGSFMDFQLSQKKAGASSTNVNVNTEKSLLNNLAGGLGKSMTDARDGARAALGTISTVSRLNDALDSGKVMAGPGTSFRQYGLQVGNILGVTGKDANEKLLNTRAAIQSLAQLELDAAQQMKGQGQITEAERSIIKRAASGDVDGMTTGELRVLSGVLDRTARTKIQGYNSQIKPLMSNPNAAALAPFLNVEEPPTRSNKSGVIRFDANGNLVSN